MYLRTYGEMHNSYMYHLASFFHLLSSILKFLLFFLRLFICVFDRERDRSSTSRLSGRQRQKKQQAPL